MLIVVWIPLSLLEKKINNRGKNHNLLIFQIFIKSSFHVIRDEIYEKLYVATHCINLNLLIVNMHHVLISKFTRVEITCDIKHILEYKGLE